MTDEPAILLEGVCKSFGSHRVLDDVQLEVAKGETVAILGASGSGKSITLKTINGLVRPDSGRVTVLGEPVSELREKDLVAVRRRVSYLFQWGALFDSMNVLDNIAFPIREHLDLDELAVRDRVHELLGMVQLEGIEELMPPELSGGMRKRVALARALALDPEVILFDEPTTGLDPVTGRAIAELILDLDRRLGTTSIVVTHEVMLVERVAERVVFLHGGMFIFSGTVAAAATEAPPQVREFFSAGGHHA